LAERQHCLGHPLQADIPEHLPEIHLRPKALTRALTNLIDNAWKYGGTEITLRASIQPGWLHLEIGDNGPGIPEGEIERLKRPFTRLENARTNATGTGLGLAIVERVARTHGGQLELLAKSNGGLLARLSLPLSS
jgi:two-component system osmolarity sensor histidine kinase EnvZ